MLSFLLLTSLLLAEPVGAPASEPVPAPATLPADGKPLPADGKLTADAGIDALLAALHRRGLDLTDFDADVKLADSDAATGSTTTRAGRVLYHKLAEGEARLRVTFETRQEDDARPRNERLEYLLDGPWLTDRNYARKIEVRRQVLRPGEKINLLRLGEGPFPLPIGQHPDDVKRQFTVSLLEPMDDKPRLRLVPVAGTRLARKFSQIDVVVDPATRFPSYIETLDANGATVRSTELSNLRVNPTPGLTDKDFALPAVAGDWKLSEEQYEE